MTKLLDTVLLLALPASGKSEVRKYLDGLSPEQCREEFRMGQTVQLDDYPYVHFMHRIDDELKKHGWHYIFYKGPTRPFADSFEWGTLVHMLNEDYADLNAGRVVNVQSAAQLLFDRLDAAHEKAGLAPALGDVPYRLRKKVAEALEAEARKELAGRNRICSEGLAGKTIVMEAARGGPNGSAFPLTPPHGYMYTFSQFSDEVLDRASVLYIAVTPEESRRKNIERARPDGQSSILHHSVPMEVMLGEYGLDDMAWLKSQSDRPDTVKVERPVIATNASGDKVYVMKTWYLKVGEFDNRIDKTTFIRKPRKDWTEEEIAGVHNGLKAAFAKIAPE
jgi:hypothetical protein